MKNRLLARFCQLKERITLFLVFYLNFQTQTSICHSKKKVKLLNSSTAAEENDAKTRLKQMCLSVIQFFTAISKHTAKDLPGTSERLQNQTLAGSPYTDVENQGSPQAGTIPYSFSTHLIRKSEFSFTLSLRMKAFKRLSAIYHFSVRCKTKDKQCGTHSHINIKGERKALAGSVADAVKARKNKF